LTVPAHCSPLFVVPMYATCASALTFMILAQAFGEEANSPAETASDATTVHPEILPRNLVRSSISRGSVAGA
jgi:hypothetical protein